MNKYINLKKNCSTRNDYHAMPSNTSLHLSQPNFVTTCFWTRLFKVLFNEQFSFLISRHDSQKLAISDMKLVMLHASQTWRAK